MNALRRPVARLLLGVVAASTMGGCSLLYGFDPNVPPGDGIPSPVAVYLHARNQRSWAGRPAALLLVVGFGMVLVTYSGSLWFSGLHAYSGL